MPRQSVAIVKEGEKWGRGILFRVKILLMNCKIRLATPSDLQNYTDLLQQTYEFSYTNPKIGLTKDLFSKEIFNTVNNQNIFRSRLVISSTNKTWLIFSDQKLVGSITCSIKNEQEAEMIGFYVHPQYQKNGIGKKLYNLLLKFAKNRDLLLDTHIHNKKTIDVYTKWGWKIDTNRGNNGYFICRWPPEQSDGLNIKCIYLRLKHN